VFINISFDSWSSASGVLFVQRRIYVRGRWTPLVLGRLRYSLRDTCDILAELIRREE